MLLKSMMAMVRQYIDRKHQHVTLIHIGETVRYHFVEIVMKYFTGYSITPVAFKSDTGTQGSEMKVTSPQVDKIYTCKVVYNGDEVTSKPVQLNVFGG